MHIRRLSACLAVLVALAAPAVAQRDAWEQLGETRVGFGHDRDVITIGQSEDWFRNRAYRRLRFVVDGGDLKMRSIRLVYLNGHAEDIQVGRTLHQGEQFDLDLRGERSFLRQIEMSYQSKFGITFGGGGIGISQASVRVYGENARRGGPPPPPVASPAPPTYGGGYGGGGWAEIGRESFDRTNQSVVIEPPRDVGRVGQIRIRNDGESITLREVVVQFRNGEQQRIQVDQQLEPGAETRRLDLSGDRPRSIYQISLMLEPRRRPGQASVTVFGTERPGREDSGGGGGPGYGGGAGRDWVPLGEQTVGFGVDRDVIRLGHAEDWYRNRSFGRLHFIVEGNDIHFQSIDVTYLNGFTENYPIDQFVRVGSDVPIDLRGGRRSYIREIAMTYRSRPGFGGRAVVKVYGEPSRR